MAIVFSKFLTKTDIEKRLSVPTVMKKCFLNFRGQHKEEFKAIDMNGEVWIFRCSTRKEKRYPKPVLSKGWLPFVRCWKLAVGDEVILHRTKDKAGKEHYVIEVIQRASHRSSILSPLVQNHNADRTTAVESYRNVEDETTITSHILDQAGDSNINEESTLTSHSTDQAITYDQTEGLHIRPVTDRKFEFIDFFELGSQERREKGQPSFLTLYQTATYFKFL